MKQISSSLYEHEYDPPDLSDLSLVSVRVGIEQTWPLPRAHSASVSVCMHIVVFRSEHSFKLSQVDSALCISRAFLTGLMLVDRQVGWCETEPVTRQKKVFLTSWHERVFCTARYISCSRSRSCCSSSVWSYIPFPKRISEMCFLFSVDGRRVFSLSYRLFVHLKAGLFPILFHSGFDLSMCCCPGSGTVRSFRLPEAKNIHINIFYFGRSNKSVSGLSGSFLSIESIFENNMCIHETSRALCFLFTHRHRDTVKSSFFRCPRIPRWHLLITCFARPKVQNSKYST